MTLSISSMRYSQANQFHWSRAFGAGFGVASGQHHRADLAASDTCFLVQFNRESLPRKFERGNMRQHCFCIYIDSVAARGLNDRDSVIGDMLSEVAHRSKPVSEIVFMEYFLQAYCDGFEIPARQPAISREALAKNQQVFFLLGELVVVGAQEAADIGEAVLLCRHGAAIRV